MLYYYGRILLERGKNMNANISVATVRNWERLNVNVSERLTSRANKRLSKKTFLPLEYFSDTNNVQSIENVVDFIISNQIDTFSAIYSIAINLLIRANIFNLPHVQRTLSAYKSNINDYLFDIEYPLNERDLLGLIYQSVSLEGEKNEKGSYYTPQSVVQNMLSAIILDKNQLLLDPCCGSGSFLLSANAVPTQLFGIDNDYIAVFICKINLLLKYPHNNFVPQIYCADFLQGSFDFDQKFDYIVTNPPWGAICKVKSITEITSKESFSYFFVKSYGLLKNNGIIRFLFPESILNVKVHKDIRSFMLSNGDITSITLYDGMFSGVTTKYVDIEICKKMPNTTVNVYTSQGLYCVARENFYSTDNLIFNFQNTVDSEIIQRVRNLGCYTLRDSVWALGIVTGDNKKKLLPASTPYTEIIYTGKEISPYVLKVPTKHIVYDRKNFQQVAKEEIYRADEKLVYKFISNKLVFAYDNSRSLFLNSANILIPKIPHMSIKTALAFLNSELYQYLYCVLFSEIKILKGNLIELPFPNISAEQNLEISALVDKVLAGEKEYISTIQTAIYGIFGLTEEQITHIKEKLNGTFN